MRLPRLEGRVSAADLARVQAFARAWRSFHRGRDADAFRALVRLGLDAAARPAAHDERWHELHDRLERVETLLDALGRAASATPALVAWLVAQAPGSGEARLSAEALAATLEALLEADWDERCRARGLPRAHVGVRRVRRPVLGMPEAPGPGSARRLVATTVRLSARDFERAAAYGVRGELGRQAALAELVQRGLDVAEAQAAHDDIAALLDSARRIEQQLDAIGALATSPAAVAVHLWRRAAGLSEEWERMVLGEVEAVAEATWHSLQAGPPRPVPGRLVLEPGHESEGDGWPT